jgi:hypothetical protein
MLTEATYPPGDCARSWWDTVPCRCGLLRLVALWCLGHRSRLPQRKQGFRLWVCGAIGSWRCCPSSTGGLRSLRPAAASAPPASRQQPAACCSLWQRSVGRTTPTLNSAKRLYSGCPYVSHVTYIPSRGVSLRAARRHPRPNPPQRRGIRGAMTVRRAAMIPR